MPQDDFTQYKRKAAPADEEFAEFKRKPTPVSHANEASIHATPGGAQQWLKDVEGDVRYGTVRTVLGKVLAGLGAKGTERGVSKETADYMTSPIIGPIHVAQGVAETPDHPIHGPAKAIGGILDTLAIPSSFVAPEVSTKGAMGLLPSTEEAMHNFREVMSVVKDHPVSTQSAGRVALEMYKNAAEGDSLPMVVRKFIQRVTRPGSQPLTYEEARGFYQNASRLSASERMSLTANAKRMTGEFVRALGSSIESTVAKAGKLEQYDKAMSEYYSAKKMQRSVGETLKALKKYVPYVGAAYVGKKIYDGAPGGK